MVHCRNFYHDHCWCHLVCYLLLPNIVTSFVLIHVGRVGQIYVSKLCQHWFWWWLVTCLVPSHYLNQWWIFVNWIIRNIFQWNLNKNLTTFIEQNWFENNVCKMWAILSRRQYVNDIGLIFHQVIKHPPFLCKYLYKWLIKIDKYFLRRGSLKF